MTHDIGQKVQSMMIQDVIATVNQMQSDGVIERCAIGGAVGATFYLEPVATLDVDIFIAFNSPSLPISLRPVYDYLSARGWKIERKYVLIIV